MNKVRVFNYNHHPLQETFKGDKVEIEANDYWRDKKGAPKEIDLFEANDFRGQYRPVPFDGSGKMIDDPKYHKKIRLEPVGEGTTGADTPIFKCMAPACKFVGTSDKELATHSEAAHPAAERLVLPEQDFEITKKAKTGAGK